MRLLRLTLLLLVPLLAALGRNGNQRSDPDPRPEVNQQQAVQAKELKLDGDKETKVQSQLTAQDPMDRVRRKSPCHVYEVKLLADVYYKIDLMSDAFDSFLRLENRAG